MYKYSVLTCLFGKYDGLCEVKKTNPDVEYVCVTDIDDLVSKTWKIVKANKIHRSLPFINQWTYVRYHPYDFVNSDVCIYVDGSIDIVDDFTDKLMMPFINSEYEYGVLMHPWRSRISDDNDVWVQQRDYNPSLRDKINNYLSDNEYDVNGLIQSTILITKNTKDVSIINDTTWELCHQWTFNTEVDRNNQSDLTYVINTLYYDSPKIMFMSPQVINSDYMHWLEHGTGNYYGWDGYCSEIAFDKYNKGIEIYKD